MHSVNNSRPNDNFTTFNTTSDPPTLFAPGELIAAKSLYGTLGFVGSAENLVVIAAIATNDVLLDVPSNWFVLSLALADAVVSVAAFPRCVHLPESAMVFLGVCLQFALLASAGNLLFLTFNRFLSVYDSLRYPSRMTVERAKHLVLAPWCVAVLLTILTGLSIVTGTKLLYVPISYYISTTVITLALNVYMLKAAMKQRNAIKILHVGIATGHQRTLRREHRLWLRLVIVAGTFIACCIPTMVIMASYPTAKDRIESPSFFREATWAYFVALVNAVVDPVVYFMTGGEFKRFLSKVKRCVFPRSAAVNFVN